MRVPRGRSAPAAGGGELMIAEKGRAAAWDARAQGTPIVQIAGPLPNVAVMILVEDRLVRKLLADAISVRGLASLPAADLDQAAELLRACRPDVLVLDPVLSRARMGAVSDWLAAQPALSGVPVLVLAGWAREEAGWRLAGLERRTVIPKPVSVPRLMRSIAAALAQPA